MTKKKTTINREEWGTYVKDLAAHLESKYSARNTFLEDVRQRRFMQHDPEVPEQYKETAVVFKAPITFDLNRKAGAMIGTQMPEPKVRPLKEGSSTAQELSSLMERWFAAAYRRMDEGKNEYLKHIDALIGDSGSVLHLTLDKHRWAGKTEDGFTVLERDEKETDKDYIARVDEHHKANFPFGWQQFPLDTFYPVYDADNKLVEVIIQGEREAYPLAKKYGLSKHDGKWQSEGKKLGPISPLGRSGNVKFKEYWNCDLMLRMLDDDVVEAKVHNYGRPPFWETRAVVTSSRDVLHEVMGLSAPLIGLQDTIDSLGTMFMNWILMTAYPTPELEAISDQAVHPGADYKLAWKIGKMILAPEGYRIKWPSLPQISGDLKEFFGILNNLAKDVGLATILSGQMPQGDVSGPAVTTMLAVAKSIFGTLVANLCKTFDEMAGWMAEMIEKEIHEAVPVWARGTNEDSPGAHWIEMEPKDIKGHYVVEHSMKYVLPAEKWQATLGLTSLKNQGVPVPDEKILGEEGLGISDPETWVDLWEVQEMAKAPEIRQVKIQLALQELMGKPKKTSVKPRISLGNPPQPQTGPGGAFMPQLPGVQTGIVPGAPNAAPAPQPNPASTAIPPGVLP